MYGLILPQLWWITLLGIINLYIMEKVQFAYFYKKPELIGNELNHLGLSVMGAAPIFMFFFGYWHFGNR